MQDQGFVSVTSAYLQELYETIEKQRARLALALEMLDDLGYDMELIADATS